MYNNNESLFVKRNYEPLDDSYFFDFIEWIKQRDVFKIEESEYKDEKMKNTLANIMKNLNFKQLNKKFNPTCNCNLTQAKPLSRKLFLN